MSTSLRPAALVAVALSVALGMLAGCGGEADEPRPSASPTPSPSASSSSASVVPMLPPEAQHDGRAGAVAFVKHYIELLNYAQGTGDTSALRSVTAPGCKSCAATQQYIDDLYARGGIIEGGEFTIKLDTMQRVPDSESWTAFGGVTYGPQTVRDPEADPIVQVLTGGRTPVTLVITRSDGGWEIAQWSRDN